MQSAEIVAKKLQVDEDITACVKEYVFWVLSAKFQREKHCLVKHLTIIGH